MSTDTLNQASTSGSNVGHLVVMLTDTPGARTIGNKQTVVPAVNLSVAFGYNNPGVCPTGIPVMVQGVRTAMLYDKLTAVIDGAWLPGPDHRNVQFFLADLTAADNKAWRAYEKGRGHVDEEKRPLRLRLVTQAKQFGWSASKLDRVMTGLPIPLSPTKDKWAREQHGRWSNMMEEILVALLETPVPQKSLSLPIPYLVANVLGWKPGEPVDAQKMAFSHSDDPTQHTLLDREIIRFACGKGRFNSPRFPTAKISGVVNKIGVYTDSEGDRLVIRVSGKDGDTRVLDHVFPSHVELLVSEGDHVCQGMHLAQLVHVGDAKNPPTSVQQVIEACTQVQRKHADRVWPTFLSEVIAHQAIALPNGLFLLPLALFDRRKLSDKLITAEHLWMDVTRVPRVQVMALESPSLYLATGHGLAVDGVKNRRFFNYLRYGDGGVTSEGEEGAAAAARERQESKRQRRRGGLAADRGEKAPLLQLRELRAIDPEETQLSAWTADATDEEEQLAAECDDQQLRERERMIDVEHVRERVAMLFDKLESGTAGSQEELKQELNQLLSSLESTQPTA